ncbi:MAG: tetratricopeptide repeat protein [Candidatus Eisenbacteria sp.]|nr:tetratricopeptide repeat protein [Candidatus Eisenbacteria bacterium]
MRYRRLIALVLAVIVCASFHSQAFADREKALEHYSSGLALMEESRYRDAIKSFEKAVHEDFKFADAHAKLAAVHFRLATIEERRLAAEEYGLAIRYDPDNPDYHLALGRVQIAQSFDRAALVSLRKTIELDPERDKAYLELGLLQLRLWRDEGKDLRESYETLLQAYGRGSTDRELLHTLGQVANEVEEFEIAEEVLLRVVLEYPSDSEARFQYAMALHGLGRLAEAEEAYLTAISMTGVGDRAFYLGVQGVASAGLDRELRGSNETGIADLARRFWREQDPLPSTAVNERLLEHWRRILQADLRFSAPKAGCLGRYTARGQTYVRFGIPTHRVFSIDETRRPLRRDEAMLRHPQSPQHNYDMIDLNPRPAETWTYWVDGKPFELTFRDRFLDGQFGFAFDLGRDAAKDWETFVREIPQIYLPEYEGKQIRMFADACAFFRNPGTTLQEIYYAIPARQLRFRKEESGWSGRLVRRIVLYDLDWKVVAAESSTIVTQISGTLDNVRQGTLVYLSGIDLKPGRYFAAISLEDPAAGIMGLAEIDLSTRSFDWPGVQLSDIQLAQSITTTDTPNPFDKGGLTVVPEPSHFFHRAEPVNFYYEIYGLGLDEDGRSRFKVTVRVIPVDVEDAGGLWQLVRRLFRRKPTTPPHIGSTFTHTGSSDTAPQRLSLDLSPLRYGKYDLSVSVEDLVDEGTASGKTVLYITR